VKNATVGQSLQLQFGAGADRHSIEHSQVMRIRLKYYLCDQAGGDGKSSAAGAV
jgi:hypothetical protein